MAITSLGMFPPGTEPPSDSPPLSTIAINVCSRVPILANARQIPTPSSSAFVDFKIASRMYSSKRSLLIRPMTLELLMVELTESDTASYDHPVNSDGMAGNTPEVP
ncbi:hypothetical protein D3C86_1466380 [compost metagenome]